MDLKGLFAELEAGFYVVPETQHFFVWKNTQIRVRVIINYFI
jgi:uncharacterized protein with ParB-like and HNH nuclease domain